jgi:hypothetical protein
VSWQASAWAMDKGKDYDLDAVTRYVLLILANYADKEGNDIYPSLGTLEGDTGLSERTIRRHIKTLIDVGLLDYGDQSVVVNHPKIRMDQRPKVYRLVFNRDAAGAVDFGGFGKLPSANPARKTRKKHDRTNSPAVETAPKPVDNSAESEPTTGLSVPNDRTNDRTESPTNQLNQKDKPASTPEAVDLDAVRALREASRARLEARGFKIQTPIATRGTP